MFFEELRCCLRIHDIGPCLLGWERHVYWDAGTMLAQLLALADSAGLAALLFTRVGVPDYKSAAAGPPGTSARGCSPEWSGT